MMDRKLLEAELPTAAWRKRSRSAGDNACVEAAPLSGGHLAVCDSKAPDGPALIFTPTGWAAFAACINDGEFAF